MTLSAVLRSLSGLVVAVALAFMGWLFYTWSSSQPFAVAAVRGVQAPTITDDKLTVYPVKTSEAVARINARRYALYNVESGKLLEEKDAHVQVPIASTTKLMTSYLADLHGNPEDVVTVSGEAARQIGSRMELYKGEKISFENLLYGMLLVSGNDAAYAVAEHIGGKLLGTPDATPDEKVARFVEEMNATAKKLQMQDTRYSDPAGLDDTGTSTAVDLAKIASVLYTAKLPSKIMETPEATVTDVRGTYQHTLRNSNRHVADYFYSGTMGGKTGFTPDAGHCLVSAASRDGMTLIAVILSTYQESKEASALEARKLLDFGFANYQLR